MVAFALGMLCYSYLEIILFPVTGDALIGSLGHETAVLWFLIITAEFLHRSFAPRSTPADTVAVPAES